jgi:hypothetical protein
MSKTMPISEVKTRLPELVSGVQEREEKIVVTRNGKPAIGPNFHPTLPRSFGTHPRT